MVSDIRINIGLTRHKKYKRLKRLLGESPAEYLLNYWGQVAEQQPDGETDWDAGDIEDFADWTGEEGLLVNSMVEVGFLTEDLKPHNWEKRQTWAIGAEARSEKARRAAEAKWNRRSARSNATSMPQACAEHAPSNAHSNAPLLSSPLLSLPNQNPKPSSPKKDVQDSFESFWTAYPKKVGKQDARKKYRTQKAEAQIDVILKDLTYRKTTRQWMENGGQFVPNPSTYLNQRRWEDEQVEEVAGGTGIKRTSFSGIDYGESTVGEI